MIMLLEKPRDVCPAEIVSHWAMRITLLIGVGMMEPVCADPSQEASLKGQGPTQGKKVFEPLGSLETPVCQKSVEAQRNAEPTSYPEQKQKETETGPCEVPRRYKYHDVNDSYPDTNRDVVPAEPFAREHTTSLSKNVL